MASRHDVPSGRVDAGIAAPVESTQLATAIADNDGMKPANPLWPLPTVLRVVDLRVARRPAGAGLVFEVDVTDGSTVTTWRFGGVSLVATRPVEIDEDGPMLRTPSGLSS